jgi:hypothetical protein
VKLEIGTLGVDEEGNCTCDGMGLKLLLGCGKGSSSCGPSENGGRRLRCGNGEPTRFIDVTSIPTDSSLSSWGVGMDTIPSARNVSIRLRF